MKANMGNIDRIVRIFVAVIIAVLYLTGVVDGTFGIILLIVGAVFLMTSFMKFCPAYLSCGLNTCKKKDS